MASRRDGRILLVATAVEGAVALVVFSHPAEPFRPLAILLTLLLGLVTFSCWVGLLVHSLKRHRLPVGLVLAPVLAALVVGLVQTGTSARLRFLVVDRAAFEQVVSQVPAPVVALPDHDLTAEESDESFTDFPGPCPKRIASLRIRECATFTAGYLLYGNAGSGVLDDGGIAYLPAGAPGHDVGNGNFEDPRFVHLAGPWYAFSSSW